MKTKEFVERVQELGYTIEYFVFQKDRLAISDTRTNIIMAVGLSELHQINVLRTAQVPTDLFDLAVEYVKTPIEERGTNEI